MVRRGVKRRGVDCVTAAMRMSTSVEGSWPSLSQRLILA
jgi:hypothetical protein